ncbi:Thioredoxin reductase [Fundidesulfovibrio magnetotacticus]|uniref:Thioredoxin reductase n=1 Tax=Fundidesulfovibrio magnetotacticus TaxID=2730080 RepID=A0A6V8LHR7_9BACT|nr:FAD-dependent oxidoreductase [Fundidesulfovibrio magnetotacticus]GFK92262.1 Thioredoxin reductase [Fundidesulfovibrio magnetotacticus]
MGIFRKLISAMAGKDASMDNHARDEGWHLPERSRDELRHLFQQLDKPVNLHAFTREGENDVFNHFLLGFLRDLARLSERILVHEHVLGGEEALRHGVTHSPTVLVAPERLRARFVGAPLGEEGRTFLAVLLMVSRGDSGLTETTREILAGLTEERVAKVFVTPTCPYCPGQAVHAFRCALERPDLVEAWCVEIGQAPDLGERHRVGSVPQTNFNGVLDVLGLEPEERFAAELVSLKEQREAPRPARYKPGETVRVDLLILGAGPAGLTAGIYAGRAGLSSLLLEQGVIGGQVSLTPVVENYPGFANIAGLALVEIMAAQARLYCEIVHGEATEFALEDGVVRARAAGLQIEARALLVATGATWRKLEVPGEAELFGRGVSHCATCDGYFYKGRRALVVGGGNTAATDALHLKNLGVDVALVHRRGELRAEKHLQDSLARENVPQLLHRTVEAVIGQDRVRAVRLRDALTGETSEEPADALFVAVGQTPNTGAAVRLGCALDADGCIVVDKAMRTSVEGVYAAGDVTGGVRQIVTAVGQGATAALTVFEDLKRREAQAKA